MDTQILEQIGLTKNEIKVYLALLELGNTSAGLLIKKLGMHRSLVYELIDLLINKGLVSFVIAANRKQFQAENPEKLIKFLTQKKEELQDKEKELKKILPELLLKKQLSAEQQEGSMYKGKKGLQSIYEDIIKEKKTWYAFGATGKLKEVFPFYFIHLHKRREKLKIPLKIIFNEKIRKERREKELKQTQIRYLPESFITPSTTYIYADKVIIIMWSNEPLAFMIKSKSVADSYKAFFEVLWKNAKK